MIKVDTLNKKVRTETGEIVRFDTVLELLVYLEGKKAVHVQRMSDDDFLRNMRIKGIDND